MEKTDKQGRIAPQVYAANWLSGLAALWVLMLARQESSFLLPFLVLLSLGVLTSYLLNQVQPSFSFRVALGFLDALVGFLSLSAQSALNHWLGIPSDPTIEVMISTSLTWYIVLRSFLMVSSGSLLWQHVPTIALFGLVSTYLPSPDISADMGFLFAFYLCLLLYSLIFTHYSSLQGDAGTTRREGEKETRRQRDELDLNRYALRWALYGFLITGLSALVFVPILDVGLGRPLMQFVLGLRLHTPYGSSSRNPNSFDLYEVGTGPISLTDRPVLRVKMKSPFYVRRDALDIYTGTGWRLYERRHRRMDIYEGWNPIENELHSLLVPATPETQRLYQRVRVVSDLHRSLYTVGEPVEVRIRFSYVLLDPLSNRLFLSRGYGPGLEYEVVSLVATPSADQLRAASTNYEDWLRQLYTQLPTRPSGRLRALALELTKGKETVYEQVIALKEYIRQHCVYNLQVSAFPREQDVVEYFLFEQREGYCDAFATALAVLCRYAGIPARVVRGFLPVQFDPDTGEYVLRDRDRHAWTEVYFPGYGWIPFDATQGVRETSLGNPGMLGSSLEDTMDARSKFGFRVAEWMINVLLIVLVGFLIWQELLPRLGWRSIPYRPTAQLDRLYYEFSRLLTATGLPPYQTHLTPSEYWLQVTHALPSTWATVREPGERFLRLFLQARYAPKADTPEQLASLRGALTAFKRELARHVPRWRLLFGILRWELIGKARNA